MFGTSNKLEEKVLTPEFFREQAQTFRMQLVHTPLRERRYELHARAELYDDMAERLAKN